MSCSLCFRSFSATFYGASAVVSNRPVALKRDNVELRADFGSKMKEVSNHAGWSELAP